jgi:predicted dehydrogenase
MAKEIENKQIPDDMKIALIGCGAAAQTYYLPALKKNSQLWNHLYLVDTNNERAGAIQTELPGSEIINDYHELLTKVRGVIIALPHSVHYPVAMDFINNGVHVLCEKPLAESTREILEMVGAATEKKIELAVNNTRRMYPTFQKIKNIIDNNEIGKVTSIRIIEGNTFGWQSATGFYVNPKVTNRGVLLDIGAHVVDLVCWWLQQKPDVHYYEDDSFGGPESIAHLFGQIGECKIEIFINRLCDIPSSYSITGELAQISGQITQWNNMEIRREGKIKNIQLDVKQTAPKDFVEIIFQNFIDIVIRNAKPLIPANSVLDSIKCIEECYNKRKRISFPFYENMEHFNA